MTSVLKTLCLVWGGIAIGVSFLATPAKFAAPSLALPVALDVGRHTFAISHVVQLAFAAVLAWGVVRAAPRGRLLVVGAVAALLVQVFALMPLLDAHTSAVIAGRPPSGPLLHVAYVVVELSKVGLLIAAGACLRPRGDDRQLRCDAVGRRWGWDARRRGRDASSRPGV